MPRFFIEFENENIRGAMAPTISTVVPPYYSEFEPSLLIADLSEGEANRLRQEGAHLIPSRQYEPLPQVQLDLIYQPLISHPKNLNDVLAHINAHQAWNQSQGKGIHIAIVDTGTCGNMSEFPPWKKAPHSWSYHGNAWTDLKGHGSMTACIAAATNKAGGRYNGVAPDANLIACKTTFDDAELYQIYDYLISLVEKKKIGQLVVNNSYGLYQCSPSNINLTDPFLRIVLLAISKGIVVVFAAGNNHVVVCKKDPLKCEPNTILGVNSLDEVISVGTVDENNRMDQPPQTQGGFSHRDSSRGPGELAQNTTKPDCVAPTYGEVMWGCGYTSLEWWGTSGAAPLVAGLAALLLSKNPKLTPAEIQDIIKKTCVSLPLGPECVGAGLIDCQAAIAVV